MSRIRIHSQSWTRVAILLLLVVPSASFAPLAVAQEKSKRVAAEKRLCSVEGLDLTKRSNSKPVYWISPDGRHFAYVIDEGIVIDGQTQKYKYNVKPETFRFSPDSQRTVYVVLIEDLGETLILDGAPEKKGWNFISHEGAVFSRDSKHVAYLARRYVGADVEYVLMIDGKEREVFKDSPAWNLSFTVDGRRVVWGESVDGKTLMRETSVDGTEKKIERTHTPALQTVNFFFGGQGQMGYIASDRDGKYFVFYDGKEDPLRFEDRIEGEVLLSTDGMHMAYLAEPSSFRRVVVVDGKQSKVYGGLNDDYIKNSLALSPNGLRSGWGVKNRDKHSALIDGREGKAYRDVSGIVFSPDSKRVAYRAISGNKLLIVIDGQEGRGYDELGEPIFSSDSKTVASAAGAGEKKFIVSNGKDQKNYANVGDPVFSPDGKRLVYEAEVEAGGKSLLVDNGKEGKPYDDIKDQFYFSDDGKRLATVVFEGDKQMVVVDGVEGNRYDTVVTLGGAKVHFDAPDRFHYLAAKDGGLYLVEETIHP